MLRSKIENEKRLQREIACCGMRKRATKRNVLNELFISLVIYWQKYM